MGPAQWAAIGASVVLAALTVFQIAMVFGAPLGHMAWGGQHRVLPAPLRSASLFAIVIYGGFALVLLERAGLVSALGMDFVAPLAWGIAAYGALGTVINAISRSRAERMIMTPVALVLGALALTVAMA